MPLVSQRIPHLLNGVSQKPDALRDVSQLSGDTNGYASSNQGLGKRPGTRHIKQVLAGTGVEKSRAHIISYGEQERYLALASDANGSSGNVKVVDAETGVVVTSVNDASAAYLNSPNPASDIRFLTVGRETFVLNRSKVVARGTAKAPTRSPEALIAVVQADYGTQYRVRIDGTTILYSTAEGTTPALRSSIATDFIATNLKVALEAEAALSGFVFTLYGSTIHVTKADGSDFAVAVADGLGDNGLRVFKDRVQRFSDLPTKAAPEFVIEVTGEPGTDADNYYVQFKALAAGTSDGVWVETVKPGENLGLDSTTLPHRLVQGHDVLPPFVNLGIPEEPKVLPYATASFNELISKAVDGGTQSPGDDLTEQWSLLADLQESDCIFSSLSHLNGAQATVRVNYSLTAILGAAVGYTVTVWTGGTSGTYASRTWTQVAAKHYSGPFNSSSEFLEFTTSAPAGTDIRIAVIADLGAVTSSPVSYAVIKVHAQNDPLPGVVVTPSTGFQCVFPPSQVYPKGIDFTLTVNDGAPTAFTYTSLAGDTGADIAAGLQALVDANATFASSILAAGTLSIERPTFVTFTCVFSSTFNAATMVFTDQPLPSASSFFVGGTVENLSDGSSATIGTQDGGRFVITGSLTGGASNTFKAGDIIRVKPSNPGNFWWLTVAWDDRKAGTLLTNPDPSFTGRTIAGLCYHRGRLGFLAGDSLTFSGAGKNTQLYRASTQDVLDGDPIGIRANAAAVNFHSASEWNQELLLWDGEQQYIVSGSPLTPKSAGLVSIGRFQNTVTCDPCIVGRNILYARGSRIWELGIQGQEARADTAESTTDVPQYLLGTPVRIVADDSVGFVGVITDNRTEFYVLQQAKDGTVPHYGWRKWTFTGSLVDAVAHAGMLYLVLAYADGVYLESLSLDAGMTAPVGELYVDRQAQFAAGTAVGISGSDLFEGTDGTLLSAHAPTSGPFVWTPSTAGTEATIGVKIVGNGAQLVASSGSAAYYYVATGLTATHVKATLVLGNTDNQLSLFLRAASATAPGSSNYRATYWRALGQVQLFRGATQVGTFTIPTTTGTHVLELDVADGAGTTAVVTVTLDGTAVITYNDASRLTGTFVGAAWGAASGAAISSSMSDIEFTGGSTIVSSRYALPYPVPVDGSAGVVQVVKADGTVVSSSRPDTTHVQAAADLSGTAVTIGLQYTFQADLTRFYFRSQLRDGSMLTEVRGRLQLRNLLVSYQDSRDFTVRVSSEGRTTRDYILDLATQADGDFRVSVLSENTQTGISIFNSTPNPSFITALDYEALYYTRNRRV